MPIVGPFLAKLIADHWNNSNLGRRDSYIWYGPRWAQAATAPSRLVKGFTTEGGIRVPAFIRCPGGVRGGQIGTSFSTVMDIAPTFLDLAGIAHPGAEYRGRKIAAFRGRSLRPWIEGHTAQVHAVGTSTGWELFGRRAIRQDEWKALYVPNRDGTSRWQLYDLSVDRGEIHDLAETHPQRLLDMLALWRRYRDETGVIEKALSVFDADPSAWAIARRPIGRNSRL